MAHHSAVKVTVYWGDILYDTRLCLPKEAISIGRGQGSTYLLDLETHTPVQSLDLVRMNESGVAELQFDDALEGHVRFKGGMMTLSGAIKKNQAIKLPNGMYQLLLNDTETAEVMMGHVTFQIDWVRDALKVPKSSPLHWKNAASWVSFLLFFIPLVYVLQKSTVTSEDLKPPERLVQVLPKELVKPRKKVEPKRDAPAEAAIGERKTKDGGAQKGELGKAELVPPKSAKPTKTKVAKTPPPTRVTKTPAQQATSAAQTIRNANLGSLVKGLASLGAAEAPAPTKNEGYVAPIQQTGSGGFSTEGLKKGGGGKSVGIGRTVGQGEGGFEGTGRLGLSGTTLGAKGTGRGGRAARTSSDGLDREVIDNIVRQRKDRIRLCYERQLNFFPKLSGKITVHFEIGSNGQVLASSLAEDTMRNDNVKSCVLSEVKTWSFPKPQGGVIVPVDYPFVFESSSLGRK